MFDEGNEVYKARIALLDEKTVLEYLESGKASREDFQKNELPRLRAHFNKCVDESKSALMYARQAKFDLLRIEQALQLLPRMRGVALMDESHRLFTEGAKLGNIWRYNASQAKRMAKDAQGTHRFINNLARRNANFIKNLEDRLAEIQSAKKLDSPKS